MNILKMDRRKGKTKKLIKESHNKWLHIVCANKERAEYISAMARDMKISIPQPISVSNACIRSPFIEEVLVDDIEDVLYRIIGKRIVTATTSCKITSR